MSFEFDQTENAPIPETGAFDASNSPAFMVETPATPFTEPKAIDEPSPVEMRACVICHREFNPASSEKCQSRPQFDSQCCPHEDCHNMGAFA